MPTFHPRRARRAIPRSDRIHWPVVLAITALAGGLVLNARGQAGAARAAWGDATPIVRAKSNLEPGDEVLDRDAFEVAWVPAALAPGRPLTDPAQVTRVVRPVLAGALMTELDVAMPGTPRIRGRGLVVTVAPGHPAAEPGTRLELAVSTHFDPYDASSGDLVLIEARVLSATDGHWFVDVPADAAAVVARASISGIVTPLIVGAP